MGAFILAFYFLGNRIMTMNDFGFVALDLSYVKPTDSGTYSCKATNELGSAVCSATLDVKGRLTKFYENKMSTK